MRVPSTLTTIFGLAANRPLRCSKRPGACISRRQITEHTRSKVVYTSSSLGSAAPRTLLPGPCSCTDGVAVDDGVAESADMAHEDTDGEG